MRVDVPEAIGAKTVIGQLTVDGATRPGYVTAFGCDDGIPTDRSGAVSRSDLNYDGRVTQFASNRLIVQADNDGEVCFYTSTAVDIIVDVNAVSFDVGVNSFPNRRTDTRDGSFVPQVHAGGVHRLRVPEAVGAKTVIGQLTVDHAAGPGYVTAYGCDQGLPRGSDGDASKSDLNYDGRVAAFASNRLIVQADDDGDVCFYTLAAVDVIVDLNAVTDTGIASFANRRSDTRRGSRGPQVAAGETVRVHVPEAVGAKTVIGQLTVDRTSDPGYVTAYGCDDGLPRGADGEPTKSDLNYNGAATAFASNRLIVQADADGDVCFYTSAPADVIVDVNAVSSNTAISSFANRRTDTRTGLTTVIPPGDGAIPVWPEFHPAPALDGVAALTGGKADASVTARPIVAVKIDNYRAARPHWGIERADAVIELNVEGVSRFVALFHTRLPSEVGPVRSARTADLDLLSAMNRPVFAYSGANPGVTDWIRSAALSGVTVDFSGLHRPCYQRTAERPGPHNLLFDATCAVAEVTNAGPARPLWSVDGGWTPPAGATVADSTFRVPMDGVVVDWKWDTSDGRYLRYQDEAPHVTDSGAQIAAHTVVELFTSYIPSPVDGRSPHAVTIGTGDAVIHREGRAIEATWARPTAHDPFTFTTHDGDEVPLDRGVTWLELIRRP